MNHPRAKFNMLVCYCPNFCYETRVINPPQ